MNIEKEKQAIQRLKVFEPTTEPYYLCYSGGKDSDAIRILATLAGVNHELHHNLTTVDAPETVQYVRKVFAASLAPSEIHVPELNMWQLIVKKAYPPTRIARYCCEELKESGGKGRIKITGVRKAESSKRKINNGLIKILGKPVRTMKYAEALGARDFGVTPAGGGNT